MCRSPPPRCHVRGHLSNSEVLALAHDSIAGVIPIHDSFVAAGLAGQPSSREDGEE